MNNWENVFEVYKKHYIAVASTIMNGEKPIGVGGDHGMGASTLRATVFACGINAFCDPSKVKLDDLKRGNLQKLTAEFKDKKDEESLKNLGKFLDQILAQDPLLIKQWTELAKTVGVVWFDAHGDINTPISNQEATVEIEDRELTKFCSPSTSGNFHGMPVATALGFGPELMLEFGSKHAKIYPQNIVYLAIRDLDEVEEISIEKLKTCGLKAYNPQALQERGMAQYGEAIRDLIARGVENIVIEHDVDGANAARYPATGTPVGPGSTRNTAAGPSHYVVRQAVRNILIDFDKNIVALDVAEGAGLSAENKPLFDQLKNGLQVEVSKPEELMKAAETFHSSLQILCSFLGLDSEQKKEIFGDALQQVDENFHNETKKKSIDGEKSLGNEAIPLNPGKSPVGASVIAAKREVRLIEL